VTLLAAEPRRTAPPATPASATLAELRVGDCARFVATELRAEDRELLSALGLAAGCRLRVCRAGDPWIVQVRTTRIGLADSVARTIRVIPDR
jgi:Fe2+ transport system protein FeoA